MSRKSWEKWFGEQSQPRMGSKPPRATAQRRPVAVPGRSARRTRRQNEQRRLQEIEQVRESDLQVQSVQMITVDPVPKPRMTQADRWNKRPCVLRYRAFCDELRIRGVRLPHAYRLEFVLPMPASWSEAFKSEMDGQPHLVRPDTSNLVKAVEDALVPKDERLHKIQASKVWGREGLIRVFRADGENFEPAAGVAN